MIRRSARCIAAIALAAAFFVASAANAQTFKAQAGATPIPPEIAGAIRELLAPASVNITSDNSPYCEIWIRATIPAAGAPASALGVSYTQLTDGEYIGAIHFDVTVKDFRNQAVKPGTYILRYGLQPVDGNHQGVSDYRDFLLLTPPDADTSQANLPDKELYILSRKTTTTGHPSVWSLVPAASAPTVLPGIKKDTDEDFTAAYFKAMIGTSQSVIGLVVYGHAQLP